MDVVQNLLQGFALALTPSYLVACLVGVVLGTLVGVLPGLGPPTTMALLLPLTFGLAPTTVLIMFAGIFYGSKYGGAVTSILMNVPGETSSIVTTFDGYQMAKKGGAGPALGIAAIASFFAGTLGVVGLMVVAPPLGDLALRVGPPEYFALVTLGLTMVCLLSGRSMAKALLMGCLGLAISIPGLDPMTGSSRLTFGQDFLLSGIDFVLVGMGLFAVGEILVTLEESSAIKVFVVPKKLRELLPSRRDLKESLLPMSRSTVLGFLVGALPGGNPAIATFVAYGAEKAIAKDPESFGTGTVRGVAAAESADNAATSGSMIPLMTLGIPTNAATAMMMAGLIFAGLQPGPLLMKDQPQFFWVVIASMYVGNVLLLILNLPLVPVFASLLRIPYHFFYPLILAICAVGAYSTNNSVTDVMLMGVFGVVGYALKKLDFPMGPLVLCVVLGPLLERSLRQSLTLFDGDFLMFFHRPFAAVVLGIAIVCLISPIVKSVREWILEERRLHSAE
jgi:putative tricarboxylic transport membrane protein